MTATLRVAATGDIHCSEPLREHITQAFATVAEQADLVLIAGDLTTHGEPEQAAVLADACRDLTIPVLAVLGNHDYHGGHADEISSILRDAGVTVLDGDAHEVKGVGFAGVKGFGGGFGPRALGPWGEDTFKRFVHEAVEEALKLEAALARLRTRSRVAVLHYAPVRDTVDGERFSSRVICRTPIF